MIKDSEFEKWKKDAAANRKNSDLAEDLAHQADRASDKFGKAGDYVDAGELQKIAKRLYKLKDHASGRAELSRYRMEERKERLKKLNSGVVAVG